MKKVFKLAASEMQPIATGLGSCIASDHITVKGKKVGYMYRDFPDNEIDSGWRFMSGKESQKHMDDPSNLEIYDVNTIANYDPEIVPFLSAPCGAAFERDSVVAAYVRSSAIPAGRPRLGCVDHGCPLYDMLVSKAL
jgi:hypothetical protein